MAFIPRYSFTPKIIKDLTAIDVAKSKIIDLPITMSVIASLRESARLASTHHSTAIEGNQLLPSEVEAVIKNKNHFPNKQKDEDEVRNYYKAITYVEDLAKQQGPLSENDIKMLHGLSYTGRAKPTPYRDGQNVIRNGKLVVYIPPKAIEVPNLMSDLVAWIQHSFRENLPIPLIAGLSHYQLATIHPYYDGNGRTARLLTTLILHKYGYDLKGIYSLEEYYARDLQRYYNALTVGNDEDYYEGHRAAADLTAFLEYFIQGMAQSFDKILLHAQKFRDDADQTRALRNLSFQQRQTLTLFLSTREITAKAIASFFQLSDRQARHLCQKWVRDGFLEIADPAPKTRRYRLVSGYEALVQMQLENTEI